MDRVLLVEGYPEAYDWTVIRGWHCSCFGFDSAKWDATVYAEDELRKVAQGWPEGDPWDAESIIAPLILSYIGKGWRG